MAAPVITSAVLDKTVIAPGGVATLTVVASDPDNRILTLDITATDSTGATARGSAALSVGDPVTLKVTCLDPKVTVTDAGGGKFTVAVSA